MDTLTSTGIVILLLIAAWVLLPIAVWEMNSKLKKLVKLQTANNQTMIEIKGFIRQIVGDPLTADERVIELAKSDPECIESLIHEGKLIAAGIAFKKQITEKEVKDTTLKLFQDKKISRKECERIIQRKLDLVEIPVKDWVSSK